MIAFSCLPGLTRSARDWFKFVTKFTQLRETNPRSRTKHRSFDSALVNTFSVAFRRILSDICELFHFFYSNDLSNMKPQSSKSRATDSEDLLHSTVTNSSTNSRTRERVRPSLIEQGCVYNMSDCYERLRAMVPHIPANRRMSKVELLQHVIDYIQDLESALELPNLQTPDNIAAQESNRTARVPLSTISYNR